MLVLIGPRLECKHLNTILHQKMSDYLMPANDDDELEPDHVDPDPETAGSFDSEPDNEQTTNIDDPLPVEEQAIVHEARSGSKQKTMFGISMAVILIGLAAFFTDVSTEMIQTVLPEFVRVVVGAGPAILGLILGLSDAISNIIKGLSGWLSEHLGSRKSLVVAGYSVSNLVAKPLIGVFPSVAPVTFFRVLDRVGKGIRSSPRDAMVASHSKDKTGKAFGIYTAMDTLGAIAGPLLALLIAILTISIFSHAVQLQFIIIFSIFPGIVAVIFSIMVSDVKTAKPERVVTKSPSVKKATNWKGIKTIMILACIEFASLNSGFVINRGYDFFGNDDAGLFVVSLLYAGYNVIYALLSLKAGKLSDRIGRKKIIGASLLFLLASAILLAIPFPGGSVLIWIFVPISFALFGLNSGLMDSTSKAMVSDLSEKKKGLAYGMYYLTLGVLSIPESLIFGIVYNNYGGSTAFFYEAIVLVICIVIFVIKVPETLNKNIEITT